MKMNPLPATRTVVVPITPMAETRTPIGPIPALAVKETPGAATQPWGTKTQTGNYLALLYKTQGKDSEADPLHKRSLAIRAECLLLMQWTAPTTGIAMCLSLFSAQGQRMSLLG
jgi:hypothetical protein